MNEDQPREYSPDTEHQKDSSVEFKNIPIIVAEGTPYEVGIQIGIAVKKAIHTIFESDQEACKRALTDIMPYIEKTRAALPLLHEEMQGIAKGSECDLRHVYMYITEEIFPFDERGEKEDGGCTDFAFTDPATKHGHTLLGHTNDSDEEYIEHLVAIHRKIIGQPEMFTIGIGPWTSVGFNSAGIGLGGNELWMNDEKMGIPKSMLVRAILAQKNIHKAVDMAIHPDRASNYNLVIASKDGDIVNVEGSGMKHACFYPQDGRLVHTNHYTLPHMKDCEFTHDDSLDRSRARFRRALQLAVTAEEIDERTVRRFLSDHETYTINKEHSAPICQHGDNNPVQGYTIFWNVINLTEGAIDFGVHPPCRSQTQHYSLSMEES